LTPFLAIFPSISSHATQKERIIPSFQKDKIPLTLLFGEVWRKTLNNNNTCDVFANCARFAYFALFDFTKEKTSIQGRKRKYSVARTTAGTLLAADLDRHLAKLLRVCLQTNKYENREQKWQPGTQRA